MATKISIVTPTLNSARFVEECLESIHGDRDRVPGVEIQHIVVDGGSEDGTLDIVRRYPCALIQGEDDGLYDAMNIGFRRADGDVVGILNSDDTLLPGAVQSVANWYESRRAEWMVGGIRWVDEGGEVRAELPPPPSWMSVAMFASLGWNCVHHGATYLTSQFYEKIGEYDLSYRIAADYHFLARAMSDHPFERVERPLTTFRRHAGSTSMSGGTAALEEGRRIASEYGPAGDARRMAYRSLLRVWWNATNPRWFVEKRLGTI